MAGAAIAISVAMVGVLNLVERRQCFRCAPFQHDARRHRRRIETLSLHPKLQSPKHSVAFRAHRRGQAAVECALIAVPLMLIGLLIIQIGIGFVIKASIDWDARQGALLEAQGVDPTSYLAANAPSGATAASTPCNANGIATVQITFPTSSISFIPDPTGSWPTSLSSTAQAVCTAT